MCQTLEGSAFALFFSIGAPGNNATDALRTAVHCDDEPSPLVERFAEANMRVIYQSIYHHPDFNVTRGCVPPNVLKVRIALSLCAFCTASELAELSHELFSTGLNASVVPIAFCVVTMHV